MTRRMPLLPTADCMDCPCLLTPDYYARFGEGLTVNVSRCRATGGLVPLDQRLRFCLADELAWRNVAAGLAMVAHSWFAEEFARVMPHRLRGELIWRGWTACLAQIAAYTIGVIEEYERNNPWRGDEWG